MALDTTQKEWEVFSISHNIENAIICFPAKDGHVPQTLLATQTSTINLNTHIHTNKHICTGQKWKLLLPPVVGTSTFLKDIEALAKYRPLKLRLIEPGGRVFPGTIGKEEISIPRFREFQPMVPTYEMLKINCIAK